MFKKKKELSLTSVSTEHGEAKWDAGNVCVLSFHFLLLSSMFERRLEPTAPSQQMDCKYGLWFIWPLINCEKTTLHQMCMCMCVVGGGGGEDANIFMKMYS